MKSNRRSFFAAALTLLSAGFVAAKTAPDHSKRDLQRIYFYLGYKEGGEPTGRETPVWYDPANPHLVEKPFLRGKELGQLDRERGTYEQMLRKLQAD